MDSTLLRLECGCCGAAHEAERLQGLCHSCGRPLLARYDLAAAARALDRRALAGRAPSLWRYREVLPARGDPVTLGEGFTPLHPAPRLAAELGIDRLWLKDETVNPTGSFKARGISVAVTRARELGVRRLALPTAGNAGLATAAYAAAADLPADVFCPRDTPRPFLESIEQLGATLHLVDGVITDCARQVQEGTRSEGWFDLSTLKEPYRVEGKKTMGYEIAEQLGWRLPDVILYPTGGGTGIVGMWKAFGEMEEMGWIEPQRPRMISVQAAGCAPIVRAFEQGETIARPWEDPRTVASGLRVPSAVGDSLILQAIRESGGVAAAVEDAAMLEGTRWLGRTTGVLASPEGGAVLAALRELLAAGAVGRDAEVVLFITGTALSYV
jgi:threonine synthase